MSLLMRLRVIFCDALLARKLPCAPAAFLGSGSRFSALFHELSLVGRLYLKQVTRCCCCCCGCFAHYHLVCELHPLRTTGCVLVVKDLAACLPGSQLSSLLPYPGLLARPHDSSQIMVGRRELLRVLPQFDSVASPPPINTWVDSLASPFF